jgi:tetratricopeptide (TPR) repeat protein
VIAEDPNWQDYYFERADLRRRLGDPVGALADSDHAESITPPFWELHYNRADLRAELGDLSGAIADLARVVELEPAELVPWHNLVALLQEAEQHGRARRYVADGLGHHPGDPGLLCARGQLALEAGDPDAAGRDFELALAADQDFVPALAGRATLAFDAGDCALAIGDLTRALAANGPDPALLYNRAQAYQAAGQPEAAAADLDAARELGGQTEAGVR